MSGFVDHSMSQVLALQIRLYACRARLQAASDDEALHDLRIALRKLRSLLRPLREIPVAQALEQAAAVLGRRSGPLRDHEVLLAELQRLRCVGPFDGELATLAARHAEIAGCDEFSDLLAHLDGWPVRWRQAQADGALQGVQRRIRRRLRRQQRRLGSALRDPQHDRHRLRLLIKRVRYADEAYPRLSGLSSTAVAALKQAQSALGDWHDHLQWLAGSESDPRLHTCRRIWQDALSAAEARADDALLQMQALFPAAEQG